MKLIIVLFLINGCLMAQTSTITLKSEVPAGVSIISANSSAIGGNTIYYWVVSRYDNGSIS